MSCNYYHGKCIFLNGKVYEEGCIACPIKIAYNKGVIDTKKDYERPHGEWLSFHYDFMGRKKIPHDKNLGSHTERNYKVYEYFMCSICGNRSIKYDFCPWCGSKMEGETE